MPFIEISESQRRQLIDAESLFAATEAAKEEAAKYRGFMFWREVKGREYLVRSWPNSSQHSIGPASDETRATFEQFTSRKESAEARLKDLLLEADRSKRMNKALRVGRAPDTLVAILAELGRARVAEHFLVVGTNALYAYEAAAGVRFPSDAMETRDADFLYDTRKRVAFLEAMSEQGVSLLELLQSVDKTFQRHPLNSHTAVNSKGYEVDVIRRFPPIELEASEHPLRMTGSEEDLWAVRASTGEKLLSSRRFDQIVISSNGTPAKMRTVHPLDFARIKLALSTKPDRDPRKAPKDRLQAFLVEQLVDDYLPHLRAPGDGDAANLEPGDGADTRDTSERDRPVSP